MKLFAKIMLAVFVLALLLPFSILKDESGRPLMSLSKFKLPDISMPDVSLPDMPSLPANDAPVVADDSDLSGKDVFYKWQDADGRPHFTTEPPPEGVEYTLKGYDPDTNVIRSVEPIPDPAAEEPEASAQQGDRDPGEIGNPYSKESIEKLFDDAKNIEKILNERLQSLE